jgi:hypothetical protein
MKSARVTMTYAQLLKSIVEARELILTARQTVARTVNHHLPRSTGKWATAFARISSK